VTLLTTLFVYSLLSTVCAGYFGPRTLPSINLNWNDFNWGLYTPTHPPPLGLRLLSLVVVLFPAIDTVSVYPLISITLGNSIMASLPKKWRPPPSSTSDEEIDKHSHHSDYVKYLCRFTASLPPILASLLINDLSKILVVGGVFGVFVAFITPALLHYQATKKVGTSRSSHDEVPYKWHFSRPIYVLLILLFAIVASIVVALPIVH